ncbi:bifunctional DNA primase/polymerase [Nesterenkonia sp. CL21]|uniref:bifunctional DNA primase/polymerase n=1 Tax=Nesterenkonia sp. CL21 TaxID=3064894 RepID=UPI00287ABB7D|nr:bifunctional DNA primase/polymerase [Nesterenkonia sp. CL21]MDS2172397.1 bifunctional DNA primase/polymerase [Nesterenkonia sp. CL21]
MVAPDVLTGVLAQVSDARPLSVAARQFADAGVPVFPCVPGGKRPLTEHGFHDATTDLDQIAAWWGQHPEANIGVPTGAASGVVVVDVDVHGSVNGFDAFGRAHEAGLVDGWRLLVSTPSGGMHAYYPASPGAAQRSWQAARAGIDFRGDGGYIVVPPSTVNSDSGGVSYRVRRINTSRGESLDSGQLRDFLDPRPTPAPRQTGQVRDVSAERLAGWVAGRAEGERNRGLFWAACRLAENGTPPADTFAVLAPAAEHAGLTQREVSATIRSAYRTTEPGPHTSVEGPDGALRRAPDHASGRVLS